MSKQKPIKEVLNGLKMKALGGAKIPHGMSNPVLRRLKDKVVIATFIYTYNKENLESKKMPRPTYWMAADIETGELIGHFTCKQAEFSNQPYDRLYAAIPPDKVKATPEYFANLYKIFDGVREGYIQSEKVDRKSYGDYLEKILAIVPVEYGPFYKDLSNI